MSKLPKTKRTLSNDLPKVLLSTRQVGTTREASTKRHAQSRFDVQGQSIKRSNHRGIKE